MKVLIVEDEFISRTLLTELLLPHGVCHIATNGREAIDVLARSYDDDSKYDLVCLDIMMPEVDGQEVLSEMRRIERERNIGREKRTKVFMTTALDDSNNIMKAFTDGQCEAYLTKPISKEKLEAYLVEFNLLN